MMECFRRTAIQNESSHSWGGGPAGTHCRNFGWDSGYDCHGHAPHSAEEKAGGLEKSLNGIVGLETAFPVLYTELVRPGVLTLAQLIDLMHTNPAKRFGIGAPLEEGATADFTVFDLDAEETIQPEHFLSMGKSSPFAGRSVFGRAY